MAETPPSGEHAEGETLRDLYARMGLADRYFDGATPAQLWRAQPPTDVKKGAFMFQPHPGYRKVDKQTGTVIKDRPPDVEIVERDGKKWVRGRYIHGAGDYRGISVFDARVNWLGPDWVNYRIPKATPITENLAVTKDYRRSDNGATHYTIAPKNDMTLELFIQSLKVIAAKVVLEG
jgi:Tse2 ADP-ribosyltransferase toxins